MLRTGLAVFGALALIGSAAAEEEDPFATGWYLEEFENSGITDLFLYWFDAELGLHTFQLSCQKGYADVVVAAYIEPPESEPAEVVIASGDTRHAIEAVSGEAGGRYSTGGITAFTPELMDILTGQFTVAVDGVEQGRYSAKGAGEKFAKLFEACPAG